MFQRSHIWPLFPMPIAYEVVAFQVASYLNQFFALMRMFAYSMAICSPFAAGRRLISVRSQPGADLRDYGTNDRCQRRDCLCLDRDKQERSHQPNLQNAKRFLDFGSEFFEQYYHARDPGGAHCHPALLCRAQDFVRADHADRRLIAISRKSIHASFCSRKGSTLACLTKCLSRSAMVF